MKPSIREKLERLADRLEGIDAMLSAENAASNMDQFRKLSRERSDLEPVVGQYALYRQVESDIAEAEAMLADPEMRDFAEEELATARSRIPELELELQKLLLPRDPNDDKNILLEIRAGTGGDESALFAGDLFRMYSRYAERQRWQVEVISTSESDLGGYKEVICRIAGSGAYSRLKFESGGHRVQRVPETETQGRIHTSACTVAVMPEADEIEDVNLNPADLRIDTFRASGAGGQHINKTDSAVRITHLPTGIVAECQDGRSQHANKASAMRVLAARIKDVQVRAQQNAIASTRKSLIGSGDRSERIRTYNFPQGRVTDHRINLTLYKIAAIMDGDLDARLLVQHVAGCRHADLIARPEQPLTAEQMAWLESLVGRRAGGEPLAYLLGIAEFHGREFTVSPAVLIPRPETEGLVEMALERVKGIAAPRILDLGTGSGIIAVTLALENPAARVTAVDVSPEALDVAQGNAQRLGARVDFRPGSWFDPVEGERFDLIVSNPPYVALDDPHLELNGLPFEPQIALTDGVAEGNGLSCIRAIVSGAPSHLVPGGWLLFEHGYDQGEASRNLLQEKQFKCILTQPDLAGIDRISGGQI